MKFIQPDLLVCEAAATESTPACRWILSPDNSHAINVYERVYDNFGKSTWKFKRIGTTEDYCLMMSVVLKRFDLYKELSEVSSEVSSEVVEEI